MQCGGCGGNGSCSECRGSGILEKSFWWTVHCRRCKGRGICPGCGGSGWLILPPPVVVPTYPESG